MCEYFHCLYAACCSFHLILRLHFSNAVSGNLVRVDPPSFIPPIFALEQLTARSAPKRSKLPSMSCLAISLV